MYSVNAEETPVKESKAKKRTYSLKKCNYFELDLTNFRSCSMNFNNLMLIYMAQSQEILRTRIETFGQRDKANVVNA